MVILFPVLNTGKVATIGLNSEIDHRMSSKSIRIFSIDLSVYRPFQRQVLMGLVLLYFLGYLAGVPLLSRITEPIDPDWLGGL